MVRTEREMTSTGWVVFLDIFSGLEIKDDIGSVASSGLSHVITGIISSAFASSMDDEGREQAG